MSCLIALLDVLHIKFSSPSQSRCACAHIMFNIMTLNIWLTCDLCCLQMDHASSLAVCYAPVQCHVSAVHSFNDWHSLHCYAAADTK